MKESRLGVADSGLRTYTPADMPRIYVPERRRRPLYDFVHKATNHMAALKTYNESAKSLLGLKPVGLPGNIVRFQHSMIPMCMCTTIGLWHA